MHVESTDNTHVALHEFGGSGRRLLISHATGFHAHCYAPIADRLSGEFEIYGHDHRGHGYTRCDPDWDVDWTRYGDDAEAAAEAVGPDGGLIGFGHSMGGATLIMAALRNPSLFDLIIAYEPIIFPNSVDPDDLTESPMIMGARNRRATFSSNQAAIDNYSSKPPMQFFEPEVLALYVEHGFEPDGDGGVTLRCTPQIEAGTFATGTLHPTFAHLADLQTPVVVIAGDAEADGRPAELAPSIAEQLPNGRFIHLSGAHHLTPFTDTATTAKLITDEVTRFSASR